MGQCYLSGSCKQCSLGDLRSKTRHFFFTRNNSMSPETLLFMSCFFHLLASSCHAYHIIVRSTHQSVCDSVNSVIANTKFIPVMSLSNKLDFDFFVECNVILYIVMKCSRLQNKSNQHVILKKKFNQPGENILCCIPSDIAIGQKVRNI